MPPGSELTLAAGLTGVIGRPEELVKVLRGHMEEQARERSLAGGLWVEKGYVFASETGDPPNFNTDSPPEAAVLHDTAQKIDGLLWGRSSEGPPK